ncbi:Dethiobiotin synthetase [Legionella cherrii]|uniref:ATP-dependent dethiobiotin synthetase BioD n=1 Tax=Legionella cherrii TaxID=28084 RepID=A0A0W0S823_9GAMM|nr:dethiobiotin synthase [Legionella cherrii]KTC79656.1 Dethiobiotin synthetase [Legionella cherrii]
MKRFFITGTDTDCGKTYVTASLLHYFSSAAAIKPVASGCMEIENKLVNSDAQHLQKNSKISIHMDVINPWRFKAPVSPHIAAQNEGVRLSVSEIAEYCLNLQLEGIETLFIEGAGGLMVPLNDNETWIDFLKITKVPVILVVGMKLGCINHSLLTEAVLHANNIQCTGWIANCIDPNMHALSANIDTLKQKLTAPLLAVLPFAGDITMIDF